MQNGPVISRPGTSFNNLVVTAEELCRIIKSCANTNIKELKIGALYLRFGSLNQADPNSNEMTTISLDEEVAKKISEESVQTELVERVKQDLDELMLVDPHAYESLIGGELGGVGSS